jgi:Radical SAM superfamily
MRNAAQSMSRPRPAVSKPALLCVVPPYTLSLPAGIAYLLAYANQRGCADFGFLDLRLGVPDAYAPTYTHTGIFGESYVMDVPDLPLVLSLLQSVLCGEPATSGFPAVLDKYCLARGISAPYLGDYLTSLDQYFAAVVKNFSAVRFVGCSVWTSNFLTTLLFAAHLKRLRKPPVIVAGGPQVTESSASAALALRSRLFDYVIPGEGEASLLDLYFQVSTAGAGIALPGTIALGAGGEIERGPDRPLLRHEDIPLPSFDQMPLLSYQEPGLLRTVPYHLSRGCTDKCTFCSEWKFWRRFRLGSSDGAVDGVRELQRRYGAEYIAFTDSLLNGHPGRIRDFAEGMAGLGTKLSWGGFMRANMDDETAHLLRRAGCSVVFVGVESMSDETLMLMNKRRTEFQNIAALRAFLGAGIRVVAGLIPGFPGDTREAFCHTIHQLRALQREFPGKLRVNVEPFIVSPGQPLFANLEEAGLAGVPWDSEVLGIAPEYADISASIFCTVTGDNQGVERMGRLRMAEAIESDEPTRIDCFYYKVAETLRRTEFDFCNLSNGWFLARCKGPISWIYACIVNEREREDLEYRASRIDWVDLLAARGLRTTLRKLEAAHLLKPQRVPKVMEGGCLQSTARYRVAPYVVARYGDWRVRNRLLVADFVTTTWSLLSPLQAEALRALRRAPQTSSFVRRHLARKGITQTLSECARMLEALVENGYVLGVQAETAFSGAR